MKICHALCALAALIVCAVSVGCGRGDETRVIQLADDYQLTAQDQHNKELAAKMRAETHN
jgi:predicted NACHT family NTPase